VHELEPKLTIGYSLWLLQQSASHIQLLRISLHITRSCESNVDWRR